MLKKKETGSMAMTPSTCFLDGTVAGSVGSLDRPKTTLKFGPKLN